MHGGTETEVKIALPENQDVRQTIADLGYHVTVPRQFEANTLYDTSAQTLRNAGTLLRLRQVGPKGVITWKGPGQPGPHKSRPEIETTVGSVEELGRILGQLGFKPRFRYEKYRTEFAHVDAAESVITYDETPIGLFLELEGPSEWIDRTAQQLGFSSSDYVLESYGKLYLSYCEQHQLQPEHMTFASHVS